MAVGRTNAGKRNGGGGGSVVIWDEPDAAGGVIRHIEADSAYGLEDGTGTPSTSQQEISPASGKYFRKFTMAPIPSNYVDTSDADAAAGDIRSGKSGYVNGVKVNGNLTERDDTDLTVSGDTVTVPPGIYDIAASKSVAAGTAGTPVATKGAVNNHAVPVTPSVTNGPGYINGGLEEGTPVVVTAAELVSGTKQITENGTGIDVTDYASVDVAVSGGAGLKMATAVTTPAAASASISFTGLLGEPNSFVIMSAANLATGASPYKVAAVVFDGTDVIGQYITNTNNAQMTFSASAFSKSYNNGTLTVTGTGANFQANQYKLIYTYGGTSANIGTADVQVGSGATSITFTGLPEEPTYWSVIFKSNIGTASGYTRAHAIASDGEDVFGLQMGSGSQASDSAWTATYNNGSLTITSRSSSDGGYFHQPGYYQLTYAIGGEIELTVEELNVTENGTYTAPRGKAYSPVNVNVPSGGGSDKAIQVASGSASVRTNGYTATGLKLTVKKTGTYKVSWVGWRSSSSGTMGSNLYKNDTAGTNQQTFTSTYGQQITLTGQSLTAGDELELYATAGSTTRYMYVANLIIEEQ